MADSYIDVDAEDLRELIHDHGEEFLHWKAALCACQQTRDKTRASLEGDVCARGCIDGYLYRLQEHAAGVVAIVTDYNKTVYSPDFGRVPSGTAKWIAMANEVLLGDRDRLVLTAREEPARELIKRGAGESDVLSHPHACEILSAVRGFTSFQLGVDFQLDGGELETPGRIVWLPGGTAPPVGEYYDVEYLRRPRLTFLSDSNRPARRNRSGEMLAQRVSLTILPLVQE